MKCLGFNCASSLITSPYFDSYHWEHHVERVKNKKMRSPIQPKIKKTFDDKFSKIGTFTSLLQDKWIPHSLIDKDHRNICMLTGVKRTWSPGIFQITNTATPGKTKPLQNPAMAPFSLQLRKPDIAMVTCHLLSHAHQPIVSKNIWPILQPSLSWPNWTIDALLHGRDFFFFSVLENARETWLWRLTRWDENKHFHSLGTLKPLRFFWTVVPHTETHKSKCPARPCSHKDNTMLSEGLLFKYIQYFTNSELELSNRDVHTNSLAP